jgi:hypothetical protein
VENAAQHYIGQWRTNQAGLNTSDTYRIRVLDGSTELGHADAKLVKRAADAKAIPSGVIGIVLGSAQPIKFRIEVSSLGPPVTASIGENGGDVGVNLGGGARLLVQIPSGAVSGNVQLTITPKAPRNGSLASFSIAPAAIHFLKPISLSFTTPAPVTVPSRGRVTFAVPVGSSNPAFLPTAVGNGGTLFTATVWMIGSPPPSIPTSSASLRIASVAAESPAETDVEVFIAMVEAQIAKFHEASENLDILRSFEAALVYRLHAVALAQYIGADSIVAEELAAAAEISCNRLIQQTDLADVRLGTDFRNLFEAVQPVLAAQAAAAAVSDSATCPQLGDLDTVLEELTDHFVELYTTAMQLSNFPSTVDGLQDQLYEALVAKKWGQQLGVEAAFASLRARVQVPIADRYRSRAYDWCRTDLSHAFLGRLFKIALAQRMYQRGHEGEAAFSEPVSPDTDFGFGADDLDDDIQFCGTKVTVRSADTNGDGIINAVLGGAASPGFVTKTANITAKPHGTIELGDMLIALRCANESLGNDVIGVFFNNVRVKEFLRIEPTAHFIRNGPRILEVDSIAAAGAVDPNGGGTVPLILVREGNACSGAYAPPNETGARELLTINVTFPDIRVSLSPASAALQAGDVQAFTATVTGSANTAVTWTAAGGTFTVSGNTLTYTAGSAPGAFSVTAKSVADSTVAATAAISIDGLCVAAVSGSARAGGTSAVATCDEAMAVSPSTAVVARGGTRLFVAMVNGAPSAAVTWSTTDSRGSISAGGLYTAGSVGGTYSVKATSVDDPSQSASATVSVVDLGQITTQTWVIATTIADQYGGPQCTYYEPRSDLGLSFNETRNCSSTGATDGGTVTSTANARQAWLFGVESNGAQTIRFSGRGDGSVQGTGAGNVDGNGTVEFIGCFSTPRAYTYQLSGSLSGKVGLSNISGGGGASVLLWKVQPDQSRQAVAGAYAGNDAVVPVGNATANATGLILAGRYCISFRAYGGGYSHGGAISARDGFGEITDAVLRLTP